MFDFEVMIFYGCLVGMHHAQESMILFELWRFSSYRKSLTVKKNYRIARTAKFIARILRSSVDVRVVESELSRDFGLISSTFPEAIMVYDL